MSESAPKEDTVSDSVCGDPGCSNGERAVTQPYGFNSKGIRNPRMRKSAVFITLCLFCAAGVKIAAS
jgi:hypothetical protein